MMKKLLAAITAATFAIAALAADGTSNAPAPSGHHQMKKSTKHHAHRHQQHRHHMAKAPS